MPGFLFIPNSVLVLICLFDFSVKEGLKGALLPLGYNLYLEYFVNTPLEW
jgi:hypothetical protein